MTLKPALILLTLTTFLTTLPQTFSYATDKQNPWDSLEKAQSLKCSFGPGISTEWKSDEPKTEDARFDVEVYLRDIDHQTGRARLMDNGESTDVSAYLYPMSANFIGMTGMGNISVITVYPYYLKGTENFPAAWSKHLYLADGPLTSQFYGTCKAGE
jgi:hypothetical protein